MAALLALLPLACYAVAQNVSDPDVFDIDPYLQYRPEFARSLPIQILLTGIVLTLVSVLLIHLIFTAQYHWPLAPVNYVLQVSSVTALLIALFAVLHVVLSATISESQTWPYMLSYIAINIPPFTDSDDWNTAEWATWLVMNAATSGLIQIAHIHFLTFLYPSRLEGRLIFFLFGPLAIVAAAMQLMPMQSDPEVALVASFLRNVCNATLSLLCTIFLIFWGVVVNRRQAWRTDGGTAAFGAGTLFLSLTGTVLNFFYVPREEEYLWLPGLIWAVVLWQNFLGWWWWVGAGSGGGVMVEKDSKGQVEEVVSREEKRERRRRERTARKQERKDKAQTMWRGIAGVFESKDDSQKPTCRDVSSSESTTPHSASTTDGSFDHSRALPSIFVRWCSLLRHAHQKAAREQAKERIERIWEMERSGGRSCTTWGFGSFELSVGGRRRLSQTRSSEREREQESDMEMANVSNRAGDSIGDKYEEGDRESGREKIECPEGIQRMRGQSISWWGPLRRWRLQDSTLYGMDRREL